ncbi:hypothetical protein MPRG_48280 [Mycobacterium paragordonae]|uniref:Uncharacterized protein n=1 Tax=Mycobacterium paragordonae TaxID=1389713 RepID=A0ABQ1CBH7_9MYCO|nr:hypothetical protein MPRG_48280 [Mycobacterium paragordonae]
MLSARAGTRIDSGVFVESAIGTVEGQDVRDVMHNPVGHGGGDDLVIENVFPVARGRQVAFPAPDTPTGTTHSGKPN